MLSENGDVIKYTQPGTRPLDREYPKDFSSHLTQLKRHLDFTRRKQDILRLLTLLASGKAKIK